MDTLSAQLRAVVLQYLQTNLTLRKERGNGTAFFAFADTVVAKAYNRNNECHGWLVGSYEKFLFIEIR